MNQTEATLRAVKDRIASIVGEIEETADNVSAKENYRRLTNTAKELHGCADDLQNLLMRVRPR